MSEEFIREVDEELKEEKYAKIWGLAWWSLK